MGILPAGAYWGISSVVPARQRATVGGFTCVQTRGVDYTISGSDDHQREYSCPNILMIYQAYLPCQAS